MVMNDVWAEQRRRDAEAAKAKSKLADQKKEEADPLLVYTAMGAPEKIMPGELPSIRAWWWRVLTWAMDDPVNLKLAMISIREIYYVEGIMSRWGAIPDVLHDEMATNYELILQKYSDMDVSQFEGGGDSSASDT